MDEIFVSFANSVKTIEGGLHEQGFKQALTSCINNYARKQKLLKKLSVVLATTATSLTTGSIILSLNNNSSSNSVLNNSKDLKQEDEVQSRNNNIESQNRSTVGQEEAQGSRAVQGSKKSNGLQALGCLWYGCWRV